MSKAIAIIGKLCALVFLASCYGTSAFGQAYPSRPAKFHPAGASRRRAGYLRSRFESIVRHVPKPQGDPDCYISVAVRTSYFSGWQSPFHMKNLSTAKSVCLPSLAKTSIVSGRLFRGGDA